MKELNLIILKIATWIAAVGLLFITYRVVESI